MTKQLKLLSILSYVVAGLAILVMLMHIAMIFLSGVFIAMGTQAGVPAGSQAITAVEVVIRVVLAIIAVVVCVLNIMAAGGYAKGKSYNLLMATAIVNLIPCFGCCLAGLPIGIFSLIVLLNADVKALFKSVSEGKSFEEAMAATTPPDNQ